MEKCEHKFVYIRSNSYWRFTGRYSREFYYADHFFCEKCLEEKIIEKNHSCFDSELLDIPEWAKTIQYRTAGYN